MTTAVVQVVVLVVAVIVVAALVGRWVVRRRAAARTSLPPLFYPLMPQAPLKAHLNGAASKNGALHSNGVAHANGASYSNGAVPAHATPPASNVALGAATPMPRVVDDRPRTTTATHGRAGRRRVSRRGNRPVLSTDRAGAPVASRTSRGARGDGTRDREIRFVRVPGEPPHVLLGRDAGPSPSTVGLGSATVSRRHARMDYIRRSLARHESLAHESTGCERRPARRHRLHEAARRWRPSRAGRSRAPVSRALGKWNPARRWDRWAVSRARRRREHRPLAIGARRARGSVRGAARARPRRARRSSIWRESARAGPRSRSSWFDPSSSTTRRRSPVSRVRRGSSRSSGTRTSCQSAPCSTSRTPGSRS